MSLTTSNRNSSRLVILVIAAVLAAAMASTAQAFSVTNWDLGVFVWDGNTSESSGHDFRTVQNPFVNQHTVALANGLTTAAAQYDISWLLDYGSFNISAQLAAQDGNSVESLASGTIYLQTDVELMLSLNATLNYNLPTGLLGAFLSFGVRDLTTNQYILSRSTWYITYPDPTGPGLLTNVGEVALPAGHQFRVQYQMALETSAASSGLAIADGHVNFTISPEPASLSLLLLALPLLRHSARRPRALSP